MDDKRVLWFDVAEKAAVLRLEALVPALIPALGGAVGLGMLIIAGLDVLQSKSLLLPLSFGLVSAVVFVELGWFLARRAARRRSIRRVGLDKEAIYLDRPLGVLRIPRKEVASVERVRWVGFRLRAKSGDLYWIPQVVPEELRKRLWEWSQSSG